MTRPGASQTSDTMDFFAQQVDEGNTRDSAISGLSILKDDTDEFYQQSLKHLARDRRRLRDATQGEPVKAFRRARTQPNAIEILADADKNLNESKDTLDSGKSRRYSANGAPPSQTEERPLSPNVPKQWGRKGKQRNDYLRRINSTGDMTESKQESDRSDSDRIFRRRTLYTGDSPSSYDGDTPVASVEQGSPSSARRRRFTTRSLSANLNTRRALDDIMALEQQEAQATDTKQQTEDSSERLKSRSLSDIRQQQEIDNVRERAVTTSRLAAVGKKTWDMPDSLAKAFRQTNENDQGALDVGLDGSNRQKHSRQDSKNLLKQLARVSSLSPSPPKPQEAAVLPLPSSQPRPNSSPSIHRIQSQPSSLKSVQLSPTRPSTGSVESKVASDSLRLPPSPPSESDRKRTAKASDQVKTPRVTGAWIETPQILKPKRSEPLASSEHSNQTEHPSQVPRGHPANDPVTKTSQHPQSALEKVLLQASQAKRSKKPTKEDRELTHSATKPEMAEGPGDNALTSLGDPALKEPNKIHDLHRQPAANVTDSVPSTPPKEPPEEHKTAPSQENEENGKDGAAVPASSTIFGPHPTDAEPVDSQPQPIQETSNAAAVVPTTKPAQKPSDNSDTAIATPEEEALLNAMFIEDLQLLYLRPEARAVSAPDAQTAERWDALYHSAQHRTRSLQVLKQSQSQHHRHPTRHRLPPSQPIPTIADILHASLSTFIHSLHQPNSWRPAPRGYLLLALFLWFIVEESLCAVYCHPQATEWFPPYAMWIPENRSPDPWKPFVTYTKLLREPFRLIFLPMEFIMEACFVVPVGLMDVYLFGGAISHRLFWSQIAA